MHRDADAVMQAALVDSHRPPLFSFAGRLCEVRRGAPKSVREKAGSASRPRLVVKAMTPHALRDRMAASCAFQEPKRGKVQPVPPPLDLAHMILARDGEGAPALIGLATSPVLRPDGTVLAAEGYDEGTGLYLDFGGAHFPPVPEHPTQADAAAALRWIKAEAFEGFPFAAEADADVAVAALLTALALPAIEASPMFVFAAPMQGTGKTALAELIAHIAFGAPPGPQGWPAREEEQEKALLSVLREGARAVFFDNVKDGAALDSPALARAVTGATFKARILGASESAEAPSNVLWLATGNNITATRDLSSRVFTSYLDAKTERPDTRKHRRLDLHGWADKHRAETVACALTVLRGYVAAGRPESVAVASRFPTWDATVRAALTWAAGEDRLAEKVRSAGQDDPAQATRVRFIEAWGALFGDTRVSASDLVRACAGAVPEFAAVGAASDKTDPPTQPRLALLEYVGGHGVPTRERIASALRPLLRRVVAGRRLVAEYDSNAKANRYRLESVDSELPG